MSKLYTPKEVADILKVTLESVYVYLNTGQLKGFRLGKDININTDKRRWRITERALNEFMNEGD